MDRRRTAQSRKVYSDAKNKKKKVDSRNEQAKSMHARTAARKSNSVNQQKKISSANLERSRRGKNNYKCATRKINRKNMILKRTLLFFSVILIGVFGTAVIYAANLYSKVDTVEIAKDDIVINQEVIEKADLGTGYTNVALFGGDSRTGQLEKGALSDSIIIASLNNETKEVKLVSVYRDTFLNLSNGSYEKCNAAYSYGGPTQAINMLNTNLDMDIEKYVTVDFSIISEIIDLLGGVEIEIEEVEIQYINQYLSETAEVAGKKTEPITKAGLQRLDGPQATTYARIRSTRGGDFKRADRQRYVIEQMVAEIKKSDLGTLNRIINEVLPSVSTNFTVGEIAQYLSLYLDFTIGETTGFPEVVSTATLPSKGSVVIPMSLESNVIQLHHFLYGEEIEYTPSSTVKRNSSEIEYRTSEYTTGTGNVSDTYTAHGSETTETSDEETAVKTKTARPEITFN